MATADMAETSLRQLFRFVLAVLEGEERGEQRQDVDARSAQDISVSDQEAWDITINDSGTWIWRAVYLSD